MTTLLERLGAGEVLVLDSAMGTELARRGVPTPLPVWSAHALTIDPKAVLAIHLDCVRAGADLLTANTFRTTRRTLAKVAAERAGDRAAELTALAVHLAREAADEGAGSGSARRERALVLGSMAPLEDCYRPDLVPADDVLAREHAEHAQNLATAGVDAILVETMNTEREAVAAVRAAWATGLPVLASFVPNPSGQLLGGDPLAELVPALIDEGADVVLVNCAPVTTIDRVLPELRALAGATPIGAYANVGYPHPEHGWEFTDDVTPEAYGRHAAGWVNAGALIVGGCCGTTPEHLAAVRTAVDAV